MIHSDKLVERRFICCEIVELFLLLIKFYLTTNCSMMQVKSTCVKCCALRIAEARRTNGHSMRRKKINELVYYGSGPRLVENHSRSCWPADFSTIAFRGLSQKNGR